MLCQEFPGFLPSQLWREWEALPAGTLELLLEYRHYAHAYAAFRRDPATALTGGELAALVLTIERELIQEEVNAECPIASP